MKKTPNYLEDRLCLNVLANSVENAKACYEAAQGMLCLAFYRKIKQLMKLQLKI